MDKQPTLEKKKSNVLLQSFLVGSFSGTCSTLLFQPLDVIKTRLQANNRNVGMIGTCQRIIQKDGLRGFWKGTSPSLLRTVPGIGLYFTLLHHLSGLFKTTPGPIESSFLGFITRCFVGTVLLPFQVLKTRYESGQYEYRSLFHAAKTIWKTEGTPGFYRGFTATLARDAPFSSLYLLFYVKLKTVFINGFNLSELSPEQRFCCGLISGVLASITTHPPDVLKTKLQLNHGESRRTLHTLQYTVKAEGMYGLFRGLLPRLYRRTLIAAFTWTVYEEVMKALHIKREKQGS